MVDTTLLKNINYSLKENLLIDFVFRNNCKLLQLKQNRTEQNKAGLWRAVQAEQNRTEKNRIEQNRTEVKVQNSTEQ